MQEKLTILISSEHKKFIKRHARQQNKSISRFIDDLLASIKREAFQQHEKDEWIDKVSGSYNTGKKDILAELFKDIRK
jgi:predicted transcriptional regulator